MAIPDRQQPFPQSIRPVFSLGHGVHLPGRTSIKPLPIQGTPSSPVSTIQSLGHASGSRTVTLAAPNPIVVDVPLAGFTTPYAPAQTLSLVADTPIIKLPAGCTLGSVSAQPMVVLVGSGILIPASSIGRGVQVKRFVVRVTFNVGNFNAVGQSVTVTAGASLYTPS